MINPLLRPLLTEKSTGLTEKKGQYVFVVKPDADKTDIKNRAQNTRKGRVTGKKSDWKKAIITLEKGQSIDYYANTAQKSEG